MIIPSNKREKVIEAFSLLALIIFFWVLGDADLFNLRWHYYDFYNLLFTGFGVATVWLFFKKIANYFRNLNGNGLSAIKQVLISTLLLGAYLFVINWVYIYLVWDASFRDNYFLSTIFPTSLLVLAGMSIIEIFRHRKVTMEDQNKAVSVWAKEHEPKPSQTDRVTLSTGKHIVTRQVNEIRLFYVKNKITYASNEHERIPTDLSLQQWQEHELFSDFFRANRQFLIRKEAISSVTRGVNQKLQVGLIDNRSGHSEIVISRYKAAEFLEWYQKA